MLAILSLILAALFVADFGTTVYSLHRWPDHVFENGVVMGMLVQGRSPVVRDALLLAVTLASLAALYLLAPYIQGPLGYVVYGLGIVYQANTVYGNACVIRDLS